MTDESFMRRAIALAASRIGRTGENPAVGCVLVKDGLVVGEGATGDGGRPHAEEVALAQAGDRARGATAYVTLEPCAERSSGAPSCSERLAAAGVVRVVAACDDLSVFAAGRGREYLHARGVNFALGLLNTEASRLYLDYLPVRHPESGR